MQTLQKGLHGINARIPMLNIKRDFLSFSLQLICIFVCLVCGVLWPLLGFDSTVQMAFAKFGGKPITEAMYGGTHISTVLNYFLIIFLVSTYLSSKEIIGFHNAIISVMTPIFGMMVFEFPWVIFTDLFHNLPVEGYWTITLYGLGGIDVGMLILGIALIPTAVFFLAFLFARTKFSDNMILPFSIVAGGIAATILISASVTIGTLTVLIRNTFALFFAVFAYATLLDATQNWSIKELAGKYELKRRIKGPLVCFAASIAVFAVWIWWPYFTAVKGNLWPQTVYAFYKNGIVDRVVYVQNDAIHLFNVLSKVLVTAGAALLLVPRIVVKK